MSDIIAHTGSAFRLTLRRAGRSLLARIGCDCPLCGARVAGARLCAGCESDIAGSMVDPAVPRCPRCALRLRHGHCAACLAGAPPFSRCVAAFDYEPPADILVHMLKSGLRLSMAPVLAGMMARACARQGLVLPAGAVLVPVPAGRASLRRRGMNPAAEIARALAGELDIPLARAVLARRRETPRQATLDRRARRRAAQGLYVCREPLAGRHAVLVDDVMTTGSTVRAAAQALIAGGAQDVTVLVAARTPGGAP